MAPSAVSQVLLSPAELSYLHASLSLAAPLRPDGRSSTQFRPLIAEQDILPSTNGSARVCFADGTEAIVGIKAAVEKTSIRFHPEGDDEADDTGMDMDNDDETSTPSKGQGDNDWVEMGIEIPGFRDDDALPVFLSAMLTEALLASGDLKDRLWINRRFHWKLYIDVLLLSAPLSYPLPLLSITTHLALLSARLPKLISEGDEDPLFDDDWEASEYLYAIDSSNSRVHRPSITLLVIVVGENIIYDPSKEELAVADAVVAVSVGLPKENSKGFRVLSMRTVDSPSHLTTPGIPNSLNNATGATRDDFLAREAISEEGVWKPPRGGLKRVLMGRIMAELLSSTGVVRDIMEGLEEIAT